MPIKKSSTLLKSTIILGMATALAKLIGFAREIVLAALYGAGTTSDAFILSFTIPDTLLYFINGSIVSGFIPIYHRVTDKTKFTRNLMTCLLLIGVLFSTIFTVIPGALVKLFAFNLAPETYRLAVYFVRYMIWSTVFILLSEIYNAQLQINGDFFSAGIRSIWINTIVILGIVLGALSGYNLIIALAPVAGNALCMFSLSVACRKKNYIYRPYLDIHSPELKQLLIMIGPMFLSTTALEVNTIINRNFAASLSVGAISALNYSNKVQALFAMLIGQALYTVMFPHMSKLAADNNIARMKSDLMRGVMYVTAIMLPLCIGVIVLAQPGIRILFQRGSFTADDTLYTASCLQMYAITMVSGSINPLLMRAFYALQNTKIPAGISVVSVIASVALNFLLMGYLGAPGLALSTSLSGILTMILLIIFLRKKTGPLELRNNIPEFVKLALAAGVMGIGAWFIANALSFMNASIWETILFCAIIAIAAAVVYVLLLFLFKSKIVFDMCIKLMDILKQKRKHVS